MCNLYRRSIITGDKCWHICINDSINFQRCSFLGSEYRVVTQEMYDIMIPEKLYHVNQTKLFLEYQTSITSLDNLVDNIIQIFYIHFGLINRSFITSTLMFLADINNDGKISETESHSILAFLSNEDVILYLLTKRSSHVKKVVGFCSDVFLIEKSISMTIDVNQWYQIEWYQRAKIIMGLFEFVDELMSYEIDTGPVIICPKSLERLSFNKNYEVIIPNLLSLLNVNKFCNINNTNLPYSHLSYIKNEPNFVENNWHNDFDEISINCSIKSIYFNKDFQLCDSIRCGVTPNYVCSKQVLLINLVTVCNVAAKFMHFEDKRLRLLFLVYLEKCWKISFSQNIDEAIILLQDIKMILFKTIENF